MADFNEKDLLAQFKLTIGDFSPDTPEMSAFYENFLSMAAAELRANDISESVLASDLGNAAIILYAKARMEGTDTASDKSCILLRNTLSLQTKGERIGDGE